jgi:hypothetical protein
LAAVRCVACAWPTIAASRDPLYFASAAFQLVGRNRRVGECLGMSPVPGDEILREARDLGLSLRELHMVSPVPFASVQLRCVSVTVTKADGSP